MNKNINRENWEILESEEFNSLLEAVELMAKARGNLSHLSKTIKELKDLTESGTDVLSAVDQAAIVELVDKMQVLVEDLASGSGER